MYKLYPDLYLDLLMLHRSVLVPDYLKVLKIKRRVRAFTTK